MRYILLIVLVSVSFWPAKNKFTTTPQVSFKSFTPDTYKRGATSASSFPVMILHVTDAEGDLGITASDTAFVYIKNLKTNRFDSIRFPSLAAAARKNFEADVELNMFGYSSTPAVKDTFYFDVYIKDFAKNKSNVIRTDKPLYYFP